MKMTTEIIKIKKAKKEDLKEISILYKKIFLEMPYNEKWTDKILTNKLLEVFKKQEIYVAEINKKIVGFISFCYFYMGSKGKIGYIFELGIDKQYRAGGIGKTLVKRAEEKLKKTGCKSILVDANKESSAINFYKKLGYMDVGYIKMGKELK